MKLRTQIEEHVLSTLPAPQKFHPWKPGQMIKLCGQPERSSLLFGQSQMAVTANTTPLFPGPRGRQKAFKQVPYGTEVMYTDSDGEKQSLMIQVIDGEDIGWTYWSCGRSL